MKAVIDATGVNPSLAPLSDHLPTPLFEVVGKPILIHVIEALVKEGATHLSIALHHLPELIKKHAGEGERWGITIDYYYAKEWEYPFAQVTLDSSVEKVIIARGDTLPSLTIPFDSSSSFLYREAEPETWTGWGVITRQQFEWLAPTHAVESLGGEVESITAIRFLSTTDLQAVVDSNIRALESADALLLMPTGTKEIRPRVFVGKGTQIHPSVALEAPVYIGEGCSIHENVTIGPGVVIEDHCILDEHSSFSQALVCSHSYVGESLEVRNSVISRCMLMNIELDTHIVMNDDFLIGELTHQPLSHTVKNGAERAVAALILLFLSPILFILLRLWRVHEKHVVALPSSIHPQQWRSIPWVTFGDDHRLTGFSRLIALLPALVSIMKGDAHFVGVAPRTPEQLYRIPEDWRNVYLRAKIGLITLSDLNPKQNGTTEEKVLDEVYYAAHMGFWFDIKVLTRFIRKSIALLFEKRTELEAVPEEETV